MFFPQHQQILQKVFLNTVDIFWVIFEKIIHVEMMVKEYLIYFVIVITGMGADELSLFIMPYL